MDNILTLKINLINSSARLSPLKSQQVNEKDDIEIKIKDKQ